MDSMSVQQVEDNATLQADEIEALSAIFGAEWKTEESSQNSYSIDIGTDPARSLHLEITLPTDYPLDSPPTYQFSAPWMTRETKNILSTQLEDIYCMHARESILYMWIEKVRDFIDRCPSQLNQKSQEVRRIFEDLTQSEVLLDTPSKGNYSVEELPEIEHGETIVDRLSVFQAHLARVVSVNQVKAVLAKLKENGKIANATHNIFAYRICRETQNSYIQDCDDDGENKAGSVLLHLLQILNASNVLVVVTRWYGGIHLGSDRFKHISNAARNLLDQCGYIVNEKSQSKKTKKKKR